MPAILISLERDIAPPKVSNRLNDQGVGTNTHTLTVERGRLKDLAGSLFGVELGQRLVIIM